MDVTDTASSGRIGRPPKLDAHGTPTRERLINAAVACCVENGYEGATLSDIAKRADVSTPAIYSHFSGKAELLVEANRYELSKISSGDLVAAGGLRQLVVRWLQPDFANTRVLVAELHCAAVRHSDVAELLDAWQTENAASLHTEGGLTMSQVKWYYLLLLGAAQLDRMSAMGVSSHDTEAEVNRLLEAWFGTRYD
ncbi:MAG: AcrR family transcriptional regulator [Candidatus Aldehydirespiratoraceae bacterium]|jgi:AcrR family transcriptional regulator